MKRTIGVFAVVAGSMLAFAAVQQRAVEAQSPDQAAAMKAAQAKQDAFEKTLPKLQISEQILPLVVPGHTIGETEGVSTNSKGHLFVYSRTGKGGAARGGTAAELFEFDQTYKFVKEWAQDNYAASFAHSVRVDKYDNVWFVDEGSSMVVKMDPAGNVKMTLGRKPEAIDYLEEFVERGEKSTERYPVGGVGTFNRPTDVTWDSQDNIYVSDGYGNSRFAKMTKDGTWVKAVGTHGNGPNQFSTPHGIASDGSTIWVADRGNNRIQVFDTDMKSKQIITGIGAPWSVCVTPSKKFIYSGDGFTGKIYKIDAPTGKVLGFAQSSGHNQPMCLIHEISCESDTVVLRGDCALWQIDRVTFGAGGQGTSGR